MLVAASNWSAGDHMLLLRCLHDSMDVPALGAVMDGLDMPALRLPMGELIFCSGASQCGHLQKVS